MTGAAEQPSFTYNGFDLLTASDALGTFLTLSYGDANNPHSPTSSTDGASQSWQTSYLPCGQVISVTPPTGSPSAATTFSYEETSSDPAFGYLRQVTNGAGDSVSYDAYSPLGDLLTLTSSPSSGVTNSTNFEYDALRRLTEIEHPDTTTVSYAYSGPNLASTLDEAGTLTSFSYNPATNQLESISEPLGRTLAYTYDNKDLSSFSDANQQSTTYTYGLAGELTHANYPDGSTYEYFYNSKGKLDRVLTPRGRELAYNYDGKGRLTRRYFNNPNHYWDDFFYRHEDDRLKVFARFATGKGTGITPTRRREEVKTVNHYYHRHGLSKKQLLIYSYNPDGSVSSLSWKDGSSTVLTWNYSYDSAGRLSSVTNTLGDSTSYSYEGEGKIVSQTNDNGTATHYSYNQARGWPTQISHQLSGTAFAEYDLEYDGGADTVGNLTKVTELDTSEVSYSYDALSRLTAEARTGTDPYSHSYTYDAAHNVLTKDGASFASYDAANKITTLDGGTATYDASGNLTQFTGVSNYPTGNFSYKHREILGGQSSPNSYYGYELDEDGRRVYRDRSGTQPEKIWYLYDGQRLIAEVTSSGPKMAYTWGADGLVSQHHFPTGETHYYHGGPQQEVRQLTDDTGALTSSYTYTAYGVPVASSGTDFNPHRYGGRVGYYSEGEFGLVLATHRWYSPDLMRWMNRDPIEYAGGDNLYAYVRVIR